MPRLVAAIGVAATLVACGDQAATDPLLASPLAIHDGEWSGDDGAIAGRLELRGNCLYISSSGGMLLLLVFGRDGLAWDAKASAVRIGGVAFPVSQPVRFAGGGGVNPPALNGIGWFKPPAAECDTSRVWFVGR